jgi:predicted phage terminase large subunit-like protein
VIYKGSGYFFASAHRWISKLAMVVLWLSQGLRIHGNQKKSRNKHLGLNTLEWGRRYLSDHFRKAPSQMHEWLGDQLDGMHSRRGTKLNVMGPRGGAKSTIGTLCYVLRAALEGWEEYIWVISDTKTQAQAHLENIKAELESNELLKKQYPLVRCKSHAGNRIKLTNGTVVESFGTGQKLRGRRERAARPSLIVCDDLQNDSHMQSARQRAGSRSWFHGTLLKAGNKKTNVINLATALHREALAMQLHDQPAGWITRKFAAIEHWPTRMDLWQQWEDLYCDPQNPEAAQNALVFFEQNQAAMQLGAKVLWPAEEDLYTLMKMRAESGRTAFEREKQNSPVDPEKCEWPAEYFGEEIWFDCWPQDLQFTAIALDPSKGREARHGDYSAFVVLGVDRTGTLYVAADLARRDTQRIVSDGVALCKKYQAQAFSVEANQFQELLADQFVAEFARQGIFWCVPSAIHNFANKQMRIRRLGPYLSQRRLRFLRGNASTKLLVNQLQDFPLGSHDDGPDALEMALRLAEEVFRGGNKDDGLGMRLVVGE